MTDKPKPKNKADKDDEKAKKPAVKKPAKASAEKPKKAKKVGSAEPSPKHVKAEKMEGFVDAFSVPVRGARPGSPSVRTTTVVRTPAGQVPPAAQKPAAPAVPPAAPSASAPAAPARPAVPPPAAPVKPVSQPPAAIPPKPAVPAAMPPKPAVPAAMPPKPAVPPAPARPAAPAQPGARPAVPPPAAKPAVPPPAARPAAPAPAARPGAPAPAHKPAAPAHPARPAAPAPAHKPAAPAHPAKPAAAPAPAAKAAAPAAQPAAPAKGGEKELPKLKVNVGVTVRELAEKMAVKPNDVIKKLIGMGVFATINQRLDEEAAVLIAHDFNFDLEMTQLFGTQQIQAAAEEAEKPENLKPRPPIVTVMGHVDHGKTSLLDAIRETNVADKEAGAITQHIGAYKVKTPKGELVFLDTPGHAAFTAMRARGTKVTDLVVLVVSAVDGVQPQTLEAIDHAKAAGAPIVVAINKIDLPGANAQKIKQELASHGLQAEDWGGKTIMVEVSAKKRLHLDTLLEMLLLQSEMLTLKANPDRPGNGTILEARLDSKRGVVANLLVQNGTVKVGDPFVVGNGFGRVRALIDDRGNRLQQAGPATPVELLGMTGEPPQAGDILSIVANEKQAREIAEKRRLIHREEELAHQRHVTLLSLKGEVEGGAKGAKDLRIILKADVQGSLQALKDTLEKQAAATTEIVCRVIGSGTGNVSESDVLLAKASDAVILAFTVGTDPRAKEEADRSGIEIRTYKIIYELLADVKAAMEGLLAPEIVESTIGKLEVRQVFAIRGSKIAGCMVQDGKAQRSAEAKVLRGGQQVFAGKVAGLKRFKDDVKEVEKGFECGISLEGFNDYKIGDLLEIVVKTKQTRRLEAAQ
jgi:translation initiation factor IF-2